MEPDSIVYGGCRLKKRTIPILSGSTGYCRVDETGLRDFLWQRTTVVAKSSSSIAHTASNNYAQEKHPQVNKRTRFILQINGAEKTRQHLVLKGYSTATIKTYTNELSAFLQAIKHYPAESFTTERIRDYLQYCAEKLKLSENTFIAGSML